MSDSCLFGKIPVVLGGDFAPILPVVRRGLQQATVQACLQHSSVLYSLQVLRPETSMRIEAINSNQIFFNFLKSLVNDANMYRKINLPAYIGRVETVDHLCDQLYPQTSVRYRASRAPKKAAPRPNSPPRPAERPGAGRVLLWFPAPAPGPARSPDRSPLKQVGRNGAPSKECAGTRPGRWRGGDHPQNNPPGPL